MRAILEPVGFQLAVAAGALAALLVQRRCARKNGLSAAASEWLAVLSLPLGVFFGHFLYALVLYNAQPGDPTIAYLFKPWAGGFMFWGVAGGAVLACFLANRLCKERFLPMMDTVAVALIVLVLVIRAAAPLDVTDGVSQGYGRPVGELLEAFGLEYREEARYLPLFFAPEAEYAEDLNLSVWLLEAIWAGVILMMLLSGMEKRPAGKTSLMALILYAAGQILLEFLREDEHPKWLYVRVSQLLAAIVLAVVVICAVCRGKMNLRRSIVTGAGMLLSVGLIIFMAFMIEKPLILGDEVIFFPQWLVYISITIAAAAMGILTWQSVYPLRGEP